MKELTLEQREQQRQQQQPIPPELQVRTRPCRVGSGWADPAAVGKAQAAGGTRSILEAVGAACSRSSTAHARSTNQCHLLLISQSAHSPQITQIFEGRVVESEGRSGNSHVITAVGTVGPNKQTYNYATERVVGNGSFGVVFQATCLETAETVSSSY